MQGYRKKESRSMKNKIFAPTADKTNLANVKRRQPRGGRCF